MAMFFGWRGSTTSPPPPPPPSILPSTRFYHNPPAPPLDFPSPSASDHAGSNDDNDGNSSSDAQFSYDDRDDYDYDYDYADRAPAQPPPGRRTRALPQPNGRSTMATAGGRPPLPPSSPPTPNLQAPLLTPTRKPSFERCLSHAGDELRSFRAWLRWMCVDQGAGGPVWGVAVAWAVFFLLGAVVPAASHIALVDKEVRRRSYDLVVQASLTSVAGLSFVCLSAFVRKYGLRRFLFLDKLCGESEKVRRGYTTQLNRSFQLLSLFVLPCFAGEAAYKIWWYCTAGVTRVPHFLGNAAASAAAACTLELLSWIYRTSVFFLVCVLFRITCHLQILRLQDFAATFRGKRGELSVDAASVLAEHLRVKRQLRVISHRFRAFIMSALVLVSMSQLASLLLTTRSHADVNLLNAGELALCSLGLMTGILICLRSAAKITHKAIAITAHAAKWHVCATIESFDSDPDGRTPTPARARPAAWEEDEEQRNEEEDLEDNLVGHPQANCMSYQKRQALVTYLENNRAGITLYGFMLDRSSLHMIFGLQLSLVLWLLGKTVGIS